MLEVALKRFTLSLQGRNCAELVMSLGARLISEKRHRTISTQEVWTSACLKWSLELDCFEVQALHKNTGLMNPISMLMAYSHFSNAKS